MVTNSSFETALRKLLDQYDIIWFGYKGAKGSKKATFYSYDSSINDILNVKLIMNRYYITITSQAKIEDGRYIANFQPIL